MEWKREEDEERKREREKERERTIHNSDVNDKKVDKGNMINDVIHSVNNKLLNKQQNTNDSFT